MLKKGSTVYIILSAICLFFSSSVVAGNTSNIRLTPDKQILVQERLIPAIEKAFQKIAAVDIQTIKENENWLPPYVYNALINMVQVSKLKVNTEQKIDFLVIKSSGNCLSLIMAGVVFQIVQSILDGLGIYIAPIDDLLGYGGGALMIAGVLCYAGIL